jgi:NhaP-type Na+/H+ or K+/H+ antiporter
MTVVLIYSATLLIAVLLSELARRTVLSTAVLFLAAGITSSLLGLTHIDPRAPGFHTLADLALVSILFSDSMKITPSDIRGAWRLPGRALFIGLPLTLATTAVLTRLLLGWSWAESLLVGAILSPTDPVFASAIIGAEKVPTTVKHLLNIESGLNDGLALPIVLFLLAHLGAAKESLHIVAIELALGVAIGMGIPWIAVLLQKLPLLEASRRYRPLFPLAILLLIYSTTSVTHSNEYLGAFFGGLILTSQAEYLREEFEPLGEQIAELLKLAALLMFGAVLSERFFESIGLMELFVALLALFIARPLALFVSLGKSPISWPEKVTIAWFGPKGFASVVFTLMLFQSPYERARPLSHFCALVIGLSMILHSTTDLPFSNWLGRKSIPTQSPTP